jgi:23S rRNA pseudouridine1911/1915/1917 synthase
MVLRARGGIGRHVAFRSLFSQGSGGSSPLVPTHKVPVYMWLKFKNLIEKIATPLMVFAAVLLFYFIWRFLDLPSDEQVIEIARVYFERYGLITIFLSAIVEGTLLLGAYYPGSMVIFLGVIFSAGDTIRVIEVVLVTTIGLIVAYTINFFLGRYGWYKLLAKFGLEEEIEEAKHRLEKHVFKAMAGTFWHPNFAAITSTAAGILDLDFKRFILSAGLVTFLYDCFWGVLASLIGMAALSMMGLPFAVTVIVIWVAYILWSKKKAGSEIPILYEDEDIVAINKPAGLVVHPDGRTEESSVTDWFVKKYPQAKGVGEKMGEIERPGVVHRIDRETSGVLLLAKTNRGHEVLKEQFQNRTIDKAYHLFVYGLPKEDRGSINLPIKRSSGDFRKWSAQRGGRGEEREALTYFEVLKRDEENKVSLVEAKPKTGRTHQIRVHMQAIHHPVVGDNLYASGKPAILGFERTALHAKRITFMNVSGESVTVEAPYPPDFEKAIATLG